MIEAPVRMICARYVYSIRRGHSGDKLGTYFLGGTDRWIEGAMIVRGYARRNELPPPFFDVARNKCSYRTRAVGVRVNESNHYV